jgi:hypothetical protein
MLSFSFHWGLYGEVRRPSGDVDADISDQRVISKKEKVGDIIWSRD